MGLYIRHQHRWDPSGVLIWSEFWSGLESGPDQSVQVFRDISDGNSRTENKQGGTVFSINDYELVTSDNTEEIISLKVVVDNHLWVTQRP